jgi:hypothetical protein
VLNETHLLNGVSERHDRAVLSGYVESKDGSEATASTGSAPAQKDVCVQATPTIDQALDAFLGAQRERLSAKTLRNYEDVVLLLRNSLNSCAYDSLATAYRRGAAFH